MAGRYGKVCVIRKLLICLWMLTLAGLGTAAVSEADNIKNIVVLETMDAPIVKQFSGAFQQKIDALAIKNDYRLNVVTANANGSRAIAEEQLRSLLKNNKADAVVSVATLTSVVAKEYLANKGIPLVFMCVTDPVGAELIGEVGRPSQTFITGKAHYIPAETKVELISRVLERDPREHFKIGFIYTDYAADISDYKRVSSALKGNDNIQLVAKKIEFVPKSENQEGMLRDFSQAVRALAGQVDYFWAPRGALAVMPVHDELLLKYAPDKFLVGATEESVKKGALMHITGDPADQGRDAAEIVNSVLLGADAGTIETSLPGKILFAINLDTAQKMRLAIPSDILELAADRAYRSN